MSERCRNILFLCTGNSARSILGEALANHYGGGRLRGFSAGSHPRGAVHAMTLRLLQEQRIPTAGLRSKCWDEFIQPGARPLDLVITVCDNAAGEICPNWPGKPLISHWSIPDPAAAEGSEAKRAAAFRAAFDVLESRIRKLASLPLGSLSPAELRDRLDEIGNGKESTTSPASDQSG